MDCGNCGAPLDWSGFGMVGSCGHCGSYRPLPLVDGLTDRVATLVELSERACPVCTERLRRAVVDDSPAEWCESCHGLLITDANFAELVRQRRASYRGPEREPAAITPAALQRRVPCPDCGQPMDAHPYYGPGRQVVDSCGPCHLIWLDSGELAAIEQSTGRR